MFTTLNSKNPKADTDIAYHWGDDHLLVVMGNRLNGRIKALFWAEFLFTVGMASIFINEAFAIQGNVVKWLILLASGAMYMLAGYRFFSRILYTEKIFLDADTITIVKRSPFSQQSHTYQWQHIGPVHYIGHQAKTDHPLKGYCFDYMGFETQERLIQNLHQEGNMYFNHNGNPVLFGKNVFSWDAEEMVRMMQLYAGNNMRLGPEWHTMLQEQHLDDY